MGRIQFWKNQKNRKKILFIAFGVIGILLIVVGEVFLYWERRVLSFTTDPYPVKVSTQVALPQEIIIPRIGIDLAIEEGKITSGVWQISNTNATHLDKSATVGEKGNIVIYGHNKKSIFGKLVGIKKSDEIDIKSSEEKIYKYKVTDVMAVDPSNISVVMPTSSETLTVYTCTGFLDSKRLVVKAIPLM